MSEKKIAKTWTFASDSNPKRKYQTLQYSDGSTSCNCKGWTQRTTTDGSRSCKHTRAIDMNTADNESEAHADYGPVAQRRLTPVSTTEITERRARRFNLEE
jgi:hypothetical protein